MCYTIVIDLIKSQKVPGLIGGGGESCPPSTCGREGDDAEKSSEAVASLPQWKLSPCIALWSKINI
jgi:hypothetical protein